ncbi:hypothetical protein ACL58G_07795 [Massilia sp. GER05]|uniref:hypothetical protein n=1 Tax=Massilia sp. GER05 TaxID=3394605 RepID=UPI003F8760D8
MDSPIIPIDMLQAEARAAYARRAGRDDHGFNWHAVDAIAAYQAEWDRCAAAEAAVLKVKPMLAQAGVTPP